MLLQRSAGQLGRANQPIEAASRGVQLG